MRISYILSFVCLLQASASIYSQNTLLNIELKSSSAEQLFTEIMHQSEFTFLYRSDYLRNLEARDYQYKDLTLEKILDELITTEGLSYEIIDKVVVIKKGPLPLSRPVLKAIKQQQKVISGKVSDSNGEPLPGATLIVENTTTGATTDNQGYYSIDVTNHSRKKLIVSYVGYEPQEFIIADQVELNITLIEIFELSGEVVITGYQTLSKDRAAGSFVQLKEQYFEEHPALDLATSIDGALSGVRSQVDEEGNIDFIIRGVSTMLANAQPLIVVDGFPIEGGLEAISPSDIKTINVLKDAAAASIWGARSANGVIVITTKDGSGTTKGKMNIDFNSFYSIGGKTDMDYAYPVADPKSQIQWEEYLVDIGLITLAGGLEFSNIGIAASQGVILLNKLGKGLITPSEYETLRTQLLTNNYQEDIEKFLLQNPQHQHYDLSISGNSEKNTYRFSGLAERGKGRFIDSDNKEVQLGFNNTYYATDWLTLKIDINVRNTTNNQNGLTMSEITSFPSYSKLRNADGSFFNQVPLIQSGLNPVVSHIFQPAKEAFLDNAGFPYDWNYNLVREANGRNFQVESNYVRIQSGFNAKIVKGLNWDFRFQYERKLSNEKKLFNDDTYFVRARANSLTPYDENTNLVTGKSSYPMGSVLQQMNGDMTGYVIRNKVSYSNVFGRHSIAAIAGSEISSTVTNNHNPAIVYGYDEDKLISKYPVNGYDGLDNFLYSGYTSYTSITNGQSFYYGDKRLFSAFFNGAYTYNSKYTIQTSIRTDASNIIVEDPKYRYAPFWSVGAAWILSKETYVENINVINYLKLRLTYGQSGNIVNTASILPTISNIASGYWIDNQPYSYIQDYGNPTLRWERTGTWNAAVDYSLFSNILFGTLEFYNRHGRDIIGSIDLPSATGVSSQQFNLAEIRNTGFDFEIKLNLPVANNITFRSELNLSYNNNEVLSLTKASYSYSALVEPHFEEGKPDNSIYSFNYLGMIDGLPRIQGPEETTFLPHYAPDISDAHNYMIYSGTRTPLWYSGLLTGFTANRFTALFKLKAEFGNVFRAPTFEYSGHGTRPLHEDASAVLTEENTDRIPGLPLATEQNIYLWNRYVPYFNTLVENAAYIRLQEIFISYDLGSNLLIKRGLNNLKIYAQIKNLGLLWRANGQDLDPVYLTEKPVTFYTIGIRVGI